MPTKLELQFRPDLGVRALYPQWLAMFSLRWLKEDVLAGITVACIAVPLSLAIALASGVPPAVALISAIVGSIVVALFGGTPLAVSGPAAAMAILIATAGQTFGLGGLLVVGLGCGLLQLATGVLGLGKYIRFVPLPVIAGFTAGIGAIIFIGQLPRALGLPPPDQAHVVASLTHIGGLLHQTDPVSLGLTLGTVFLTFALPLLYRKLPAPLLGVLLPSLIAAHLRLDIPTIGALPSTLPMPTLPPMPAGNLISLLGTTAIVYALASIETLLSSSAVDKLVKGSRHDPDQELIGQGLGNIATSFFGGIPITGVIARSALNVQAGAKTRRSALIHGLVLIATVYAFAPLLSRIPLAVLAGVLLSVAMRMLHPREMLSLWRSSREEGIICLVTFLAIVFIDLIIGIQAGIVAALAIAAVRFAKTRTSLDTFASSHPSVVAVEGSLTFLASSKLEAVRHDLATLDTRHGVILDLSGVTRMDVSGGSQLLEILQLLQQRGAKFALKGLSSDSMKFLLSLDHPARLPECFACTECDVMRILGKDGQALGLNKLVAGVDRFKRGLGSNYQTLFKSLADGQSPHTLFITCSDSRINPNLITSTDPGELFIIRNIGNMVAPCGRDSMTTEGAGVEFAVGILGVREIVLCAHSGCGAMKALLSDELFSEESRRCFSCLSNWRRSLEGFRQSLPESVTQEEASKRNAIEQLENLKTYQVVRKHLADGSLRLHAWYYDIGESELEQWDESQQAFVAIGTSTSRPMDGRMDTNTKFSVPL